MSNFYITTTLPYVNSDPHIGFAMEIVRADTIARYKKLLGYDLFFNTGVDEHGLKIWQKAIEANEDPQFFVDRYTLKFQKLKDTLGLLEDIHFIRTTDPSHEAAAQEFWRRVEANGYIYKKNYEVTYCVGCEMEKTNSELENDKCPIHPDRVLERISEENYFFKFSEFQKPLLELYKKNFVVPDFRFNEIKAFIERGLQDFSISRRKEKMPWGIPVPNDESQVMYVWFDALVNYISTLGWPNDNETFEKFWVNGTPTQYAGKDNLRQQSAMWQAMLMAVGLPPSHQIVINGFINISGQKISKSLGNLVDPNTYVSLYGTDALRYYLLRHISPFEDSDFSDEKFKEAYNANLANGLGNLVSRIMNMVVSYDVDIPKIETDFSKVSSSLEAHFEAFELNKVADEIWRKIGELDAFIAVNEPYKKIKIDENGAKKDVSYLAQELGQIAVMLKPLMPSTASVILELLSEKKKPDTPLFIRK